MPQPARSSNTVRFDVFEVDLRSEELFKAGRKIKLQIQPFHILAMLLEQPGEVLTREDLRNRLWPADTFVDFDHSLNTAIKKLRQALGDDKKKPRYVETLPKRGYRFIGIVKQPTTPRSTAAATTDVALRKAPARAATLSKWIGRVAKVRGEEGNPFTWVAIDEAVAAERQMLNAANDDVGLSLLVASQKLFLVPEGTPVRVLEVEQTNLHCQARILEGEHYGKLALLPLKLLAESPELKTASRPRQWSLAQ
jgi:DNA-binding winged helix-turn-helix (wHTH) protein